MLHDCVLDVYWHNVEYYNIRFSSAHFCESRSTASCFTLRPYFYDFTCAFASHGENFNYPFPNITNGNICSGCLSHLHLAVLPPIYEVSDSFRCLF